MCPGRVDRHQQAALRSLSAYLTSLADGAKESLTLPPDLAYQVAPLISFTYLSGSAETSFRREELRWA